jgi:hypothetical protein
MLYFSSTSRMNPHPIIHDNINYMSASERKHEPLAHDNLSVGQDDGVRQSKLEEEISSLEQELMTIAAHLETRGLRSDEIDLLRETYNDITFAIEALLMEWESTSTVKKSMRGDITDPIRYSPH